MNKRIQAKIAAGMLTKLNTLMKDAEAKKDLNKLKRLEIVRDYTMVSILNERMGIVGYNDKQIFVGLSDDLLKIDLSGIKQYYPEDVFKNLLKENVRVYKESIKDIPKKEVSEPIKKEKKEPDIILEKQEEKKDETFFGSGFMVDLNEYEIKQPEPELTKEPEPEKIKEKISDEELLERFAKEQQKTTENKVPEPEILTFGKENTEEPVHEIKDTSASEEDLSDVDLFADLFADEKKSKEPEKSDEKAEFSEEETDPTEFIFVDEAEEKDQSDHTSDEKIILSETKEEAEDLWFQETEEKDDQKTAKEPDDLDLFGLDDEPLFGSDEPINVEHKKEKEEEPEDILLFEDNKEEEKEEKKEENKNQLSEDEDAFLFTDIESERKEPETKTNEASETDELIFDDDKKEEKEDLKEEPEKISLDQKEEFIISDEEEAEEETPNFDTDYEAWLANLEKAKKRRKQVYLNLLMSVEKEEEPAAPEIVAETPASVVEKEEDTYKLLYKYEKDDFSYDTLKKEEYLADIYDFNHNGMDFRVMIFPIYIPKNDGATSICMFVVNEDQIAAEISSGNLKVADITFDEFNFYATGKLENRHFISSLNIKYKDEIIRDVIKTKLRPDPESYYGYGHNIIRIDAIDTLHVFPVDIEENDNSAIAILKKDYGTTQRFETYYLKDGHAENVHTDDGDYILNSEWYDGAFSVDADRKIVQRRKETLF